MYGHGLRSGFYGQVVAPGIQARRFPEGKLEWLGAAVIVVGGRAPEAGAHRIIQQLHPVKTDGGQPLAPAENVFIAFAPYADVAVHLHQLRSRDGQPGFGVFLPDLSERRFIPGR